MYAAICQGRATIKNIITPGIINEGLNNSFPLRKARNVSAVTIIGIIIPISPF